MNYDFSGYATKNDVQCADGRIIRAGAFAECDHQKVPLVWNHDHMSPENVVGHALLENRSDGVYMYGKLNNTRQGQDAKELIKNGDISALSIYANKLKQQGQNVVHGVIREVSLVLAGANPQARIDTVLVHDIEDTEEAEICFGIPPVLCHAEEEIPPEENVETITEEEEAPVASSNDDRTIQDVIDTMNEEQKNVLYALVGMAADQDVEDEDAVPEDEEFVEDEEIVEEDDDMKQNVFEGDNRRNTLKHSKQMANDFAAIIRDGKRYGSLKESMLQHGYDGIVLGNAEDELIHDATYGMENIGYLFPDYKDVTNTPQFVSRDMTWVSKVMGAVHHTPFSRIKSTFADITEDEARAKGYVKGNQKTDEVFTLLKRTTDPQTVYKHQKLDRDDVVDITSFDVVAWLKGEMRMMLDEELARAFLIGDGRLNSSNDKIKEDHIRPIWKDDDFYTIKAVYTTKNTDTEDDIARALIRTAILARKTYKGTGNPTMYITKDMLASMLLLTDEIGRDLYDSVDDLAKKLRVKEIVEVEVMENQTRMVDSDTHTLHAIIVNLADYNVGADKGGSVSLFDDFDIDYNQMKYLIETRCSGALIKPYSAIALETVPAKN